MEIISPSLTGHSHDGRDMTGKDKYDRYGAALAFLRSAFADGPPSIAELEVKARAAMLPGERQSITHSKLFKRAKKALGIQSVREGFGTTGEWFWAFPQDPGLNGAQSTGHVSSNAVKPKQVSGSNPNSTMDVGAAITAGLPWLSFSRPACGQWGSVDLHRLDRHAGATISSLIPSVSCKRPGLTAKQEKF